MRLVLPEWMIAQYSRLRLQMDESLYLMTSTRCRSSFLSSSKSKLARALSSSRRNCPIAKQSKDCCESGQVPKPKTGRMFYHSYHDEGGAKCHQDIATIGIGSKLAFISKKRARWSSMIRPL